MRRSARPDGPDDATAGMGTLIVLPAAAATPARRTRNVKSEHDRIWTVIVDDEPLAREAIRVRLQGEPDIEVVGEADTGKEAIGIIGEALPDLLFLDVQLTGMDDSKYSTRPRQPACRSSSSSRPTTATR